MATIHAQLIGDHALLPRSDLERLIQLARQSGSDVVLTQFPFTDLKGESRRLALLRPFFGCTSLRL